MLLFTVLYNADFDPQHLLYQNIELNNNGFQIWVL